MAYVKPTPAILGKFCFRLREQISAFNRLKSSPIAITPLPGPSGCAVANNSNVSASFVRFRLLPAHRRTYPIQCLYKGLRYVNVN